MVDIDVSKLEVVVGRLFQRLRQYNLVLLVAPFVARLDIDEALRALEIMLDLHLAGAFRIGHWNHDARAKLLDWPAFLRTILPMLAAPRARYYIKEDLWAHADADLRARYPQASDPGMMPDQLPPGFAL